MTNVVVTVKIMPENPEVDLKKIEDEVVKRIHDYAGKVATKSETEPLAFGLKVLKIIFVMDQNLGSPDDFVEKFTEIDGVQSAEVSDVRLAIG